MPISRKHIRNLSRLIPFVPMKRPPASSSTSSASSSDPPETDPPTDSPAVAPAPADLVANAPEATTAASPPADIDIAHHYVNRETSWLAFNARVLHEARDERTPLLERLAFLAIFNANLDEFIQKRIGGLRRQIDAGVTTRTPDGQTPAEAIVSIREMVEPMLLDQARCFTDVLLPQLDKEGVHLLRWDELSSDEQDWCQGYFRTNVYPTLTPLSVDPGHPFPFISNLSTSLGVMLRGPRPLGPGGESVVDDEDNGPVFARVKVPAVLPQWIEIRAGAREGYVFISLLDLIQHNIQDLFEGMEIMEVEPFRITRNAAIDTDDEDAEDLLELVSQQLRDRRFARAVRLEVDDTPSRPMVKILVRELGLRPEDVYTMSGLLDYTGLWTVQGINRPDLKYPGWKPTLPPRLTDEHTSIFSVIRAGDVMMHHPYESFAASVQRFIIEAAEDPDVVAIKMTLYRASGDSAFIPALIAAAEAGKQVACLVELKARFDEARNVEIARRMREAGVHVAYGLPGLKTHTKTALVVRREIDGMRVYAHVGTGNYNEKTANLYTDLGLLTCDPRITDDLVGLFHFLTGHSAKRGFEHLLVAPINMRDRFAALIDREIEHTAAWRERGADPNDPNRPAIVAKMNQLEDKRLVQRLYAASQAGVKIDLLVRGFCCLRPGEPGLSENIRVISVIGRFLEHSRLYRFHNQGRQEYFMGSADWMYRNLNARIEAVAPIFQPHHQRRLNQIINVMLSDERSAWYMNADGTYTQRQVPDQKPADLDAGISRNELIGLGTHARLIRVATRGKPSS